MASSSKQTRQITQDIETLKLVPQKNRMMVHPCQTKKITGKKIKTKKNFKINKFFFYSNKKAKKNRAQKKIKNVYTARMITSIHFPRKDILTPHRYKRTLSVHLTSNWPQIFAKCHTGVEVFSMGSFWAISLSTYWLRHQIHQMPQNKKSNNWLGHGCVRNWNKNSPKVWGQNMLKNGQKLEKKISVVTYRSFSLFQGCFKKLAFQNHYSLSCWQINISGGFEEILNTRLKWFSLQFLNTFIADRQLNFVSKVDELKQSEINISEVRERLSSLET